MSPSTASGSSKFESTAAFLQPSTTYLAATSETVVHGVFDPSIPPVAHVRSGDTLVAECVSTNSNSDYAKMVRGDPGVEDIFVRELSNPSIAFNVFSKCE